MSCLRNRILLLVVLLAFAGLNGVAQPVANKGILDLRDYNFREAGILKVKGEWEFFWQELIDPISHSDSSKYLVPISSPWDALKDIVPDIGSAGFGSYHVRILIPKDIESLAVRFTEVFSGSSYYVNGKNIGFNGLPGTNKYQTVFGYTPSLFVFNVKDSILDFVIHVSNFEHRSGGVRGSFEIGTPMQVMSARADREIQDFFLIGAFLIIGIYFMGLYLIRSELYKLFFSLVCLLMVFRLLILSESEVIPSFNITEITRLRLEYLSFYILVPLFVLMIRFVFPIDFPKMIFRMIVWICLVMIVIVIMAPISLFTSMFSYYMVFVMLTAGVILYVIIAAWWKGRNYAPAFAIGIIIVIIGAVNDMLNIEDIINTGYFSHYTMFIYLIIYAMIFSGKTQHEIKMAEQLSAEIKSINENLESIVKERTAELNEKSNELIRHREELSKSNKILQRELKIRDRLFTVMGHDIKGPISYESQMLDLLINGSLKRAEQKEMLKMIANSSRATMNLLDNLVAWGRSHSGELKSMAVTFHVEKIINETISLFDLPLKDKKITLLKDISENAVVFADKEQIKLIIRNLLANAIKFTNTGGKIRISADADLGTGQTLISISDNGVGIAPNDLSILFTDQSISPATGTKSEKGSGIGLKLCKELTVLNNGSIKAESIQGQGSTFKISFPQSSYL